MACEEEVQFPEDFLFGTGSGAYQIEGGWDQDKKSCSIWDHYFHTKKIVVHNPSVIHSEPKKKHCSFHRGTDIHDKHPTRGFSLVNGDIACDSYNKLDEDIKNLMELGVNTYRFSISWPRVLPNGDDRFVNEAGVRYYKSLIQKLFDCNITPLVTMYHWDLPNILQDLGGWSNPNIVVYFKNYADFLFRNFPEIKLWTTINEPRFVALAYGNENIAPSVGEVFNGIADYMAIRNVLLSHSIVYRLYKDKYFAEQQGEISLCLDTAAYFPENPDSVEDQECVSKSLDFSMGVFTQPLKNGTFPQSVLDEMEKTDKSENISIKRIFEFTKEEKELLINAYDFLAFNYYDSFKVRPMTEKEYADEKFLLNKDLAVISSPNADNMDDTFKGFTQVVDWFVENLNNPKLFVTENGIYEKPNVDESEKKIKYHRGILTELHKALKKGVVIRGYCVWSFMDSLEWTSGYFVKLFGIYCVDFNDENRPRSKKPSFEFFRTMFTTKALPPAKCD